MVSMAAIILGWNPDRWDGWEPDYPTVLELVGETGTFPNRWSVGRRRNISPGADAWLLLQGRHGRGLIGHAVIRSSPYPDVHFEDPGRMSMYVDVEFDALLPRGDQLPAGILSQRVPGVRWDSIHGSGAGIGPDSEAAVRNLWAEYVGPAETDPTVPVPGSYPDGALIRVPANRYERNPQARRECINYYGTSCAVCRFSFESVYGDIGTDFIHVHHIVPVSQLGPGYELDPLTDLVPLCPNCHAMAHQRTPDPYTPAELRRIISRFGYLQGDVMSDGEQESLEEARRILSTGGSGG
jgi:5-methylcytosine-specific restriction enzyme A